MHLLTSISFATVPVTGSRTPGGGVVVADRRLISNDCSAIFYLAPYAFSTFTRNDLNSGVCEFASPTTGVNVLVMYPGFVCPLKPQCSGTPTVCTFLPSIISGLIRLVTTATAIR